MKFLKHFLLLWLVSMCGLSQIIEINNSAHSQSKYNPEKLDKDVLISSSCANVSNFSSQVKGNHTEINTKSYGYFKTPNDSNFPFKEGIILSTGAAQPAGNQINTQLLDHHNNQNNNH